MTTTTAAGRAVRAVIVNHNTSPFAELCLRSLCATESGAATIDVTVADNHSTDEGVDELEAATRELGASFERTRWPAHEATTITHGDVLRDFVLARRHTAAEAFLFLDADIVFVEPDTVATMLGELRSAPDLWAVQARYIGPERTRAGRSLDLGAGDAQQVAGGFPGSRWNWTVQGRGQPRLHPGSALVANSDALARTAASIGFGTFVALSQDESLAGYYDTMALASAAMATHGLRYELSAAHVVHYFNVSYDDRTELTADKRDDVGRRLEILRRDPTALPHAGPWG